MTGTGGGTSGGTKTSTTTNTVQPTEPWAEQAQYLKDIYLQASKLYGDPLQFFPGSTVGSQSAATLESQQAGLGLVRNAGQGAAYGYSDDVLSGKYLNLDSNPFLRDIGQAGADDITRNYMTAVAPSISLGAYGRSGSGAEANRGDRAQRNLGAELGQFYSNLYGGQHEAERGRMNAMVGMQPGLAGAARGDILAGNQLGAGADQYQQRLVDEMVRRFEFGQNEPWNRLGMFKQIIGSPGETMPSTGSSSSTTKERMTQPGTGGQQVGGIVMSLLGGLLSAFCSRELKDEIAVVDEERILERLIDLPLQVWSYKQGLRDDNGAPVPNDQHIGPYAEDWNQLFGFGDGGAICFIDGIGVALAACKAMAAQVSSLRVEVEELRKELTSTEVMFDD